MPVTAYSTTAANNNGSPPNGAPEGMAPSAVNDTIRQIMADIATEAQTNAVKKLNSVAGTDTITADMDPELAAYATQMLVSFVPAGTNTGAVTLNIDGLGAKAIVKHNNVALVAGDLKAAVPAWVYYDGTSFVLLNPLLAHTANADAAEVGFKGTPRQVKTGNYTLVLTDAGNLITMSGAGALTLTIPANASVAFPIGTIIAGLASASSGTPSTSVAITSDTLYLDGTGFATSGTRTVAYGSRFYLHKTSNTEWMISGSGVT